jgi:hypothetical protein
MKEVASRTSKTSPLQLVRRLSLGAGLAVMALSLVDCGQSPFEPASGTFGSVYKTIQTANCAVCHVPGGNNGNSTLDFSTQTTTFTTLTSNFVTATSSSGACGSVKIVVSGNPSKSYLLATLFSDYSSNDFAGVTGCTPYNGHSDAVLGGSLSADEKASFVAWIQNGIPND